MTSKKVLVTGTSVRQDLLQPLIDAGFTVENPVHLLSESELKIHLSDSIAYLLGGDEFASREALSTANNLKIIAFLGMGYQSFIDTEAATDMKIAVTNTPGTLSNSVAEFTTGLLLSGTRRLFDYGIRYMSGKVGEEEKQHDLSDLHVGILGLGGIGTRIAEILRRGFGSQVSYFSRTRKPAVEEALGISFVEIPLLLESVNVLVLMTPSTPETTGLIGIDEVKKMKPGVIVINTARPEIMTVESLRYGLESGIISYAAFDGFYEDSEDVSFIKGLSPEKIMITGHIGSLTHEARDGMAKKAVRSIINVVKNGTDENIVNKI